MKFKVLIINIVLAIFVFSNSVYATDSEIPKSAITSYISSETFTKPNINSEAGFLIEINSGKVLFDKNSNKKMYPASTTKIMTAILAIENCKLNEMAVVSKNAVDLVPSGYTNAKLVPGEKISIEDLLYGLMLNSANEAANVLAEHISGSIEDFAKLMTKKAKDLGCNNTNFVNANGMHNENHYTTAVDLAKITKYCMKNEKFKKIVSTYEYNLPPTELYEKNDRTMKNTNSLINPNSKYFYEHAIGVKTGFTKQAGNCLVSCAKKDNLELICVTLKAGSTTGSSSYRFEDNITLFDYGFNSYSNQEIIKKNTIIDTIEIENATKETKYLKLITSKTISDLLPNNIDLSKVEPKINLIENIQAPITKGQKLGTITYKIKDKNYTCNLIAQTDVKQNINFISYSLIAGVILLIVAMIINFKIRKK